jgi:ABC-type branched-subunit amino acid transport system substrate-binding protein
MCFTCVAVSAAAADIVIAQISPLSGPVSPNGQGLLVGTSAYFAEVNAAGGVNGNKIVLVPYDDQYKTDESLRATIKAIDEKAPLAVINYVGAANATVVVKSGLLVQNKIPMIGARAGVQSLRNPINPYVFHTYASYWDEIDAIIDQFSTVGVKRFAVLYQDDALGQDGLAGAIASLKKRNLTLSASASYQRGEKGIDVAGDKILQSNPEAVIVCATAAAAGQYLKLFKAKMPGVQFAGFSAIDSNTLVKIAGADIAHGFVLAQNAPNPAKNSFALVREHKRTLEKFAPPGTKPNFYTLGGHMTAKVIVEALRRAGPAPTRAKLMAALETIKDFDLGGLNISFSPTEHVGSRFVELIIIGRNGEPQS